MNTHTRPVADGYAIRTEKLPGTVTARIGDTVIARSQHARVMYETRLDPVVYFPPEDVCVALSDVTDLQTFCPFKGTASYQDIILPDHTFSNGAWTYAHALPESREIEGFVGFMRGTGVEFLTDSEAGNFLEMPAYGNVSGPLVDWLLREAWACDNPETLTRQLAHKLVENGVALSRMSVLIWSLHPLIAGKNYIWYKEGDEVSTFAPSYEIFDHPGFVNSPLLHVSQGLGGVRQKINSNYADNSYPVIEDLRAAGATDYVAMPLRFSDGQTNVMTLTCDHPDGFTTANLGLIFECTAIISRFYEVFNQRSNAKTMLETYVGTRAGARVLGGEIRRGDGEEIDAAIMFCDMRASTRLETDLGREAYLALLNQFFEVVAEKVTAHGGEVLKFIGDAVLAVFPADKGCEAACGQAAAAARAIAEAELKLAEDEDGDGEVLSCACATGLAWGRVMYGNVGSPQRLDFTVIGHAANVAARLGDHAKTLGVPILGSGFFADVPGARPVGEVALRNVVEPVQAYALEGV